MFLLNLSCVTDRDILNTGQELIHLYKLKYNTLQFIVSVQLYISGIVGGVFLSGTIPLFYELSCETSHPIAEGITGAFITIIDSIFGVVFLITLQIPHIGKYNYLLCSQIISKGQDVNKQTAGLSKCCCLYMVC